MPFVIRHPSSISPRRRQRRGGFALLITITLVAFLVLILVALASFTRVETQVATNSRQQAQARQNALMALNLAVGELQKYAGPDQRVTARADLEYPADQPNARWTGVYGSSVTADYDEPADTVAINLTNSANLTAKNKSPARLLNWLISGNEGTAFDPRHGDGDVGASGRIVNAPSSVSFRPDATLSGLDADTPATATGITLVNASGASHPARLLVGAHSVASALDASGLPVDYVAAPAVDIEAPASAVPGQGSGTDPVIIGRYAWWVGDEGVKARVNLPLAGSDPLLTGAEKQEQIRNAFFQSSRAAVELMARDHSGEDWTALRPDQNHIAALYPADHHEALSLVIAPEQTAFAATDAATLSPALRQRFHDLTAQSLTVLADAYAGGLRRDLSILLDPTHSPPATDSTANTRRLWVRHGAATGGFSLDYGIPTWRHLRSFAQTRVPVSGADAFRLSPRLPGHDEPGNPAADHVGIGPVITYFSLGFRAAPVAPPAEGVEVHMNLHPLVVLWNPYNVTLKAPSAEADGSNYEVGILPSYAVQMDLQAEVPAPEEPSTLVWQPRGRINFQRLDRSNNGNFIRFRLRAPDIPPGQSLVFSLPFSSSGQVYNQRNILENIAPEPSAYVSTPFYSTDSTLPANTVFKILPGEEHRDYQLDNSPGTSSFSFYSNGGIRAVYLGRPDNAAYLPTTGGANDAANRAFFNPSAANRHWYNTAQEIDWSGHVGSLDAPLVQRPYQEPGPLAPSATAANPERIPSAPAYVFQAQALFSGHGSNDQLTGNQYIYATRWIAQGNLRATRSGRTRRDGNFNVLFTAAAGQPLYSFPWQKFNNGPGPASHRASAGRGHDWVGNAPVDAVLFEFPYENQPLFSIGQLQHANLSLVGAYPAYPVGNSLADFRLHTGIGNHFATVPPGAQLARVDTGTGALGALGTDMNGYYDISWLLNRTLWDRYYFSTVPATGTISPTQVFANPRHLRHDPSVDLQNPDHSAAGLLLAGGFNINSTSEQAWRAVLGGGNQLPYDPQNPDTATQVRSGATFSRFTRPRAGDDPDADVWLGYRTLDENQIAQLARNLVAQIRNRGPFVSVADFVNRRLVDNPDTPGEDETYRGALQAALDATTTTAADRFAANDAATPFWASEEPIITNGRINQQSQYNDGYYDRARLEGRRNATANAEPPYGGRSSFAPGYLTQADILAKIGSSLTARSDTFTIRAYGETVNPATQDVDAQAWCEAVVQRLPDYVEDSQDPWGTPAAGSASQTFGRKFKIVSFRWLSSNDI